MNKPLVSQASAKMDTIYKKDSISLQSLMATDSSVKEKDSVQLIKENFLKINAIKKWDSVVSKNLWLSLEGGYVNFYYKDGDFKKALVRYYGEMYQQITEYYFLENKLSFIYDKYYHYNVPMYLDSASAAKDGYDLFFNIDSSRIEETRSYLEKGKLFKIISNKENPQALTDDYRKSEQAKIDKNLSQLLKWAASKDSEFNN